LLSLEGRNNIGLSDISALPVYRDGNMFTNSSNLLFGFAYQFGAKL